MSGVDLGLIGLSGLRLDHTDAALEATGPVLVNPNILDTISDSGAESGSDLDKSLQRVRWLGIVEPPEPQISLRDFIEQFIEAIAAIFQARNANFNADLIVSDMMLDVLVGDVFQRINEQAADTIAQIDALNRWLVVMPGVGSAVGDTPTLTSDQVENVSDKDGADAVALIDVDDVVSEFGISQWYTGASATAGDLWQYNGNIFRAQEDTSGTPYLSSYDWVQIGPAPTDMKSLIEFLFGLFIVDGLDGIGSASASSDLTLSDGYNKGVSDLGNLIDEFHSNLAGGTENNNAIQNANSTVDNLQYYFNYLRKQIKEEVGTYTDWETLGDFDGVDYTLMSAQGFDSYTEDGGYLDTWLDVVNAAGALPDYTVATQLMSDITSQINSELTSFVDREAHGYDSLSFYDFKGDWTDEDISEGGFYIDPDTDKLYVALQDVNVSTWYNYVTDEETGERYAHGMNDVVRYNDEVYISTNYSNENNIPSSSSTEWDSLDITNGRYFSEVKDPRMVYYANVIKIIRDELEPLVNYSSYWSGVSWDNTITSAGQIVEHNGSFINLTSDLTDRGDVANEISTGSLALNEFDLFEYEGVQYGAIGDYSHSADDYPSYDMNEPFSWPDTWVVLPDTGYPDNNIVVNQGDIYVYQGRVWEALSPMLSYAPPFGGGSWSQYVDPEPGLGLWKDVTRDASYFPDVDGRVIHADHNSSYTYYKNDIVRQEVNGGYRYYQYYISSTASRNLTANSNTTQPNENSEESVDLWTDVTDDVLSDLVYTPDFSDETYFKVYDEPISEFWESVEWLDNGASSTTSDFQTGIESLRTFMSSSTPEVSVNDAMEFTLESVSDQIAAYKAGLFDELDRVMALANSDGAVYDGSGYLVSTEIYDQACKILYEDLGIISDYGGYYYTNRAAIEAELIAVRDAVPEQPVSDIADYFRYYLDMINRSSARDDSANSGVVQSIKDELYSLSTIDGVLVAEGLLVDPINSLTSIESTISGLVGSEVFNRSATHQGTLLTNLLLMKDAIDDLEAVPAGSTDTEDLFVNNFYTLKTLWEEVVGSQQTRDLSDDDTTQHARYISVDAEDAGYNSLRWLLDTSITSILTDVEDYEATNAVLSRDYFLHRYNKSGNSTWSDKAQDALDFIIASSEWSSDMGAESATGYLKEVDNILERLDNATPSSVNQIERVVCAINDNKLKYLDRATLKGIHDAYLELRGDLVFMLNKIDSVFGDADYTDSSSGRAEADRQIAIDTSFNKKIYDDEGNMNFQVDFSTDISGWTTSDEISEDYSSFRNQSVSWNNESSGTVYMLDRLAPSMSSLLEIISKFELFFEATETSNDQIWGAWDLYTTGQMVDYATWGKVTGRMKNVFYDLYADWQSSGSSDGMYEVKASDMPGIYHHFDDVDDDGGRTAIPATAMRHHLDEMYSNTKKYLHNQVLPAANDYTSTFNEFHYAVEMEARSWVTGAFAVTSPFEDLFFDSMKDVMGDSVSPEEMRLFAKILSMLLTLLIAMLGTNAQVRESINDLQTGVGTIADLEGLTISQTLANNMIARASAMAQKLLEDEEGTMSGSGEFVTADPVSSQFFFDVVSFYQGSSALMEMVEDERQRQRSEA